MTRPPSPPISPAAPQGDVGVAEHVTAILVTRGPTLTLPDVLTAIDRQDLRPRTLIIVDTTHDDGATAQVRALAASRLPNITWELHVAPRAKNFGAAIRNALAATRDHEATPWLWTLEDDSAPAANTLRLLVGAVEHSRSVAIAGTKQVRWDDPSTLISVGFSATRLGHRFTDIESGETDQGQHDGREDVLAVSLAAALIRRSVWDSLAGTDPVLGPFGDSLDLGRRAHLAGHRVIVVPQAVTAHAQLSHSGLRTHHVRLHRTRAPHTSLASTGPRRRAQLYLQFISSPVWLIAFIVLAALVAAPLRAMGRLLAKEPNAARAELGAALWLISRIPAGVSARMHSTRTSVVSVRSLRLLEASHSDIAAHRREERRIRAELRSGGTRVLSGLDLADYRLATSRRRRVLTLVLLGLVAVTLATFSSVSSGIVQGKPLAGPGLLSSHVGLADLWQAATSGWIASDVGDPGPPEPLLLALVPFTWLLGSSGTTMALFIVLGFIIAGIGAWTAIGLMTQSTGLRTWTTIMWVAAPALTASMTQARLGAIIVHCLLPWFVVATLRALGVNHPRTFYPISARRMIINAANAGLLLAVIASAAPGTLFITAVVFAVLGLMKLRPRRHLVAILLPAIVFLLPTIIYVLQSPHPHSWKILLNSFGSQNTENAPWWQQAFALPSPAEPWINSSGFWAEFTQWFPLGFGLILVLLALGSFFVGRQHASAVRLGWLTAALGLGLAFFGSQFLVGADDSGTFHAWAGPGVSVFTAGLLVAAVSGAQGLARRMSDSDFGVRQVSVVVVLGVCLLIPLASLVNWTLHHNEQDAAHQLSVSPAVQVPTVASHLQDGPRSLRVLSVQPTADTLSYRVLRTSDADAVQRSAALEFVRLLRLQTDQRDPHTQILDEAVGQIAGSGTGEFAANDLARFGIGIIILEADDGSDIWHDTVNNLDAAGGLERVTAGDFGIMWRVVPTSPMGEPAWARLTDATGASTIIDASGLHASSSVEAGPSGRFLHVAERADAGWRASLDGRSLNPLAPNASTSSSATQVFEVGSAPGTIEVWYEWPLRLPWLIALGSTVLIYGLLAVPVSRRRFQAGAA